VLNPTTTLAIILGVSACPRAPLLNPLPQCANSAADFEGYLHSSLVIPAENIINLFDSEAAASEQLVEIEDWLSQRMLEPTSPTDLIVYYTGHGGFSWNDQSYFLAINKTRGGGSEGATSIRYVDLASAIKRQAGATRKYLILDCCFAASAVVRVQTDLSQLVIDRVEDELPPSGTAVLCSSAAKLVSIAPRGERHTMFSGALLYCLRNGVTGGPPTLSLEDVGKAARKIIQSKYPADAVRPELHVPEQALGNPATVPLFPNPLWKKADKSFRTPSNQESTVPDESAVVEQRNDISHYNLLNEDSFGAAEPKNLFLFGKKIETRIVRSIFLGATALFLIEGIILLLNGDGAAMITFGGPAWAAFAVARRNFGAPSRRLWRVGSGILLTFVSVVVATVLLTGDNPTYAVLSLAVSLTCVAATVLASSPAIATERRE